jgi:photosystem II stability/assembly factor-like uncharacterized protein
MGSVAVLPTTPETIFSTPSAAAEEALISSTDSGASWKTARPGQSDGWSYVFASEFSPTKVLVSGWKDNKGWTSWSSDGGATWHASTFSKAGVQTTAQYFNSVSFADADTLYAIGDGLWKSTNGGISFFAITATDIVPYALRAVPGTDTVYYAIGVNNGSVYRSTTGGGAWSFAVVGSNTSVFALAVDPNDSSVVYAGGRSSSRGFLISKSTDSGQTWASSSLNAPPVFDLAVMDSTTVLAATSQGIARSTDGGQSWSYVGPSGLYLWQFSKGAKYELLVAGAQGLFRSTDSGASWTHVTTAIPESVSSIATSSSSPGTLLAATPSGFFRSTDDGRSWTSYRDVTDFEGIVTVAFESKAPAQAWALGSSKTLFRSTDAGVSWVKSSPFAANQFAASGLALSNEAVPHAYVALPGVEESGDGGSTWSRLDSGGAHSVAVAPSDPATLLAGGSWDVTVSRDAGQTWQIAWLTGNVYSLAIDEQNSNRMLAGTDGYGIWCSTDGGVTFTSRGLADPNTNYPELRVSSILIGKAPSELYATTQYGTTPVFHTTDDGSTWTATSGGIADHDAHTIASSPLLPGKLYVGTRLGLYVHEPSPPGDVNGDGAFDVADVFALIDALFAGGPGPLGPADANGDGKIDVADVFYLVNALFAGGAPPVG